MDFITKLKEICKEKKISIRQIERDCGLSNGSIVSAKAGMSADRLAKIAGYLGVSMEELMGEDCPAYYSSPETAQTAQAIKDSKELSLLFDAAKDASPEDLMLTYAMLTALKRKEKAGGN